MMMKCFSHYKGAPTLQGGGGGPLDPLVISVFKLSQLI